MTDDDITNLKIDLNTTESSSDTMRKIFHEPTKDELFEHRHCYYISPLSRNDDGFIPCMVFENVRGYFPMGGDPAKLQAPWVWGKDIKVAEKIADEYNRRLGLSADEVNEIIASSIRAGRE